MADGKPDLSGVWNYAGVLGFRGGPPPSPPGTPPQATFWNIEAGIKEGLPFTPVRRGAAQAAHGRRQQGQPRRRVSADRLHAVAHALAAAEVDPEAAI